jgi:hypothetical protein
VRLRAAVIGIDDEDDSTFTITVDHKTFHFQVNDLFYSLMETDFLGQNMFPWCSEQKERTTVERLLCLCAKGCNST